MMQDVLGWMFVALSTAVFAGFLFGISSAVTLVDRLLHAPRPAMHLAPVRMQAQVRPQPRLWA